MPEISQKIQLHYFFDDESIHSMNAQIRNENERELLLIFKEVLKSFDLEVEIESEALTAGGLKNIWKIIDKRSNRIVTIASVLMLAVMVAQTNITRPDKELINLQKENLIIDNELKRIELEKIKNDLNKQKGDSVPQRFIDRSLKVFDTDYKMKYHRSQFFRANQDYLRVDRVSTVLLNENNIEVGSEIVVSREEFPKFILKTNALSPNIDEKAIIDLVSPVLNQGKYQWRGVYNGDSISFQMNDEAFRNSVLNKEVEFQNGDAIQCVLVQSRKINDLGLISITSNSVVVVTAKLENRVVVIETKQGKKYLKDKELGKSQLNLDL